MSSFQSKYPWWYGCVIYEIYIRSFYDSNGDGVGDLPGIIKKLDYLASLPIDALWITPFYQSPMKDYGYDISDYYAVDPLFGTLEDFEELIERAHTRNLKIVVDQVWSHTSDVHPWFIESCSNRHNSKADWYIWADANQGDVPNNWLSIFGGTAWKWCESRQQYYLHNFIDSQPDLNWHNPDVVREIMKVVEFWLEKGVDGVRLDACNYYMHDQNLLDNPSRTKGMPNQDGVSSLNPYSKFINLHNMNEVKNIKSLRRIRKTLNKYPGTFAIGEIVAADDPMRQTVEYIRGANRLHTAYNSALLVNEKLTPKLIAEVIEDLSIHLESDEEEMICITMSTHDFPRARSRWQPDDASLIPAFEKMLISLLPTLRGIISLYQGEELGLTETNVSKEKMKDPFGIFFYPYFAGRDGCRTPMPWESDANNFGFTDNEEPWLPADERYRSLAVSAQEEREDSMLNYFRFFLKWRNRQPALKYGSVELIEAGDSILSFLRKTPDQELLCVFNISEQTNSYLISFRYGKEIVGSNLISFPATNLGNGQRTLEMEPFGFGIFERES
ncbi:MAG: alpha-glucosidase [cyanobacterium endosymbiont of Rhopalodia gibba]|jgi:alpha-glucosidase